MTHSVRTIAVSFAGGIWFSSAVVISPTVIPLFFIAGFFFQVFLWTSLVFRASKLISLTRLIQSGILYVLFFSAGIYSYQVHTHLADQHLVHLAHGEKALTVTGHVESVAKKTAGQRLCSQHTKYIRIRWHWKYRANYSS